MSHEQKKAGITPRFMVLIVAIVFNVSILPEHPATAVPGPQPLPFPVGVRSAPLRTAALPA